MYLNSLLTTYSKELLKRAFILGAGLCLLPKNIVILKAEDKVASSTTGTADDSATYPVMGVSDLCKISTEILVLKLAKPIE